MEKLNVLEDLHEIGLDTDIIEFISEYYLN